LRSSRALVACHAGLASRKGPTRSRASWGLGPCLRLAHRHSCRRSSSVSLHNSEILQGNLRKVAAWSRASLRLTSRADPRPWSRRWPWSVVRSTPALRATGLHAKQKARVTLIAIVSTNFAFSGFEFPAHHPTKPVHPSVRLFACGSKRGRGAL